MKAIERLAIVLNASKPEVMELADYLQGIAEGLGVEVRRTEGYPVHGGFLEGQDACCVLGGDGTLLGVVPEAVTYGTPLFGINQGKLGFLTTYSVEEARSAFARLLSGDYRIVKRSLLECHTTDGSHALALNDAVAKSTDGSRLITLRVTCAEDQVTDYTSDGLIFCTPTGSTAYNLSAGGPIIMPDASVLTMTPICPHTLTNRSLVFPGGTRLRVEVLKSTSQPLLTLDGIQRFRGQQNFPFEVGIAGQCLHLLQPTGHSHFHILRNKLRWGYSEGPSVAGGG